MAESVDNVYSSLRAQQKKAGQRSRRAMKKHNMPDAYYWKGYEDALASAGDLLMLFIERTIGRLFDEPEIPLRPLPPGPDVEPDVEVIQPDPTDVEPAPRHHVVVETGDLVKALKQITRFRKKAARLEMMCLSYRNGMLTFSMLHVSVGVPARGVWESDIMAASGAIFNIAKVPPTGETVTIRISDGNLYIGSSFTPVYLGASSGEPMPKVLSLDWPDVEKAANSGFSWWSEDQWERKWAKRAWSYLKRARLTSYHDEVGRCEVAVRLISLVDLYHDFLYVAWREYPDRDYEELVDLLNVEAGPLKSVAEAWGYDVDYSDEADEDCDTLCRSDFPDVLQYLSAALRPKILTALRAGFDDDALLMASLWRTHPTYHTEPIVEIVNDPTSEKMEAYEWIVNGCEMRRQWDLED